MDKGIRVSDHSEEVQLVKSDGSVTLHYTEKFELETKELISRYLKPTREILSATKVNLTDVTLSKYVQILQTVQQRLVKVIEEVKNDELVICLAKRANECTVSTLLWFNSLVKKSKQLKHTNDVIQAKKTSSVSEEVMKNIDLMDLEQFLFQRKQQQNNDPQQHATAAEEWIKCEYPLCNLLMPPKEYESHIMSHQLYEQYEKESNIAQQNNSQHHEESKFSNKHQEEKPQENQFNGNISLDLIKTTEQHMCDVLCKMALSEAGISTIADGNQMRRFKALANEIQTMKPQKINWHQPHITDDDYAQHCADYAKLKPIVLQNSNCSLQNCASVTEICGVLKRYQKYRNPSKLFKRKFADYFGDKYDAIHVLNNFHHLLFAHDAQFEDICDRLNKINVKCSLQKCDIMRRHYRDRLNDVDCKQVKESIDENLLDRIHCFYLHSFDAGFRFRKDEQQQLWRDSAQMEDNKNADNDDSTRNNLDDAIASFITTNRRSYANIQGLDRISNAKSNRFHTKIDEKTNEMIYDDGKRFFYWDYYKDRDQVNDTIILQNDFIGGAGMQRARGDEIEANIGYSVKYWFIQSRYNDLKEELLQNPLCTIRDKVWHKEYKKAEQLLKTNHAKSIKSRAVSSYDIIAQQPLTLHHVIAMMSYCNYDGLQAKFSETFRQQVDETDDDFKKRHRNFAHFARLLREFVECYGQQNIDGPTCFNQILFHGISQHAQFQTINPCFKGPLSATTSYAIAFNFSEDKGCVIQFRLNKTWLYVRGFMQSNSSTAAFIDVEWFSDYPNEEKRFFIGGYARFCIESIIICPGINYGKYITAMRAIWQKIGYLNEMNPPVLSNYTTKIAYKMLSHECNRHWTNNTHYRSCDSLPVYVDTLFHNFCSNLRVVWFFAMDRGASTYEQLDALLDHMFLDDGGIPKIQQTITLFPSATEIRIKTNCNFDGKSDSNKNIEMISNHEFWKMLLMDLQKPSELTQIIVEFSSNTKCVNVIHIMGKLYATQLEYIGWKVAYSNCHRYGNPDHFLIIEADGKQSRIITH